MPRTTSIGTDVCKTIKIASTWKRLRHLNSFDTTAMDVATSICVGFDLTPRLAQLSHLELLGKQQPKRCGASVLIEISKAREVQMVRRPTTFASKNGRTGCS